MRELRPGLWHWQAPHPDWRPTEPWDPNVSSYAIDYGERMLLFDPIAPPSEIDELVAEREAAVMLTALRPHATREEVVERLRPLLELPVEHMLPTHGVPMDRTALEGALAF